MKRNYPADPTRCPDCPIAGAVPLQDQGQDVPPDRTAEKNDYHHQGAEIVLDAPCKGVETDHVEHQVHYVRVEKLGRNYPVYLPPPEDSLHVKDHSVVQCAIGETGQ